MTTYNTGNALGSSDARDLYDNAENIDNFANGSANTYQDRLGVTRKSLAGMRNAFDDFIESSGYTVPVAYTSGIVLSEYNQLIEYSGEFYKLKAGQAPYTTTGTWGTDSAKLVSVGDATLRQELTANANDFNLLPEVGNYAALRAYTGPVTAYYVRGVADTFDGGAGVFRVDADDTTTADNGGTVLVDAAGRRWKREFSGAFNVVWFGAVGDGVTDDTVAIQAAIADLNLSGGSLVFDGHYNLGTNSGSTVTKFNITSNDVTLIFREGTKFSITSDNNFAIIFLLSGVSNVNFEGVLHIEGANTTTYSTTGIYGPRAIDIRNAAGGDCGNIHIDSVRLIRGAAAIVVASDYTSDNRVDGVTIGDIHTEDVTYGINCSQNGDNVTCEQLTTYNSYRSWFAYGCRGHRGAIRTYNHHTGGTPVNLSRFSAAEGGSNTNTEGFDLIVDVIDADTSVTCVTLRHIGDGGASAAIRDINIRASANVLNTGLTVASLLNYASAGGATTATAFAAKIDNVSITANIPDTFSAIYRDICTWATKPTILFDGTLQVSADTQLVLSAYLDLVVPVTGSWTTFTPTVIGTTTAGAATYTTQSGSYTRVGKTIFFTISLTWSAHTGTGNLRIAGLPYASSGTNTTARTYPVWTNGIALTAGNVAASVHGGGTSNITLHQMPIGGGGVAAIPMDTAGDIVISGCYPI